MSSGNGGAGCKIFLLAFGTVIILGFFSLLINFSQGLAESVKVRQRLQDAATDLPRLLSGIQAYAAKHEGVLPPMRTDTEMKQSLYPEYVSLEDTFRRVGDNVPYQPNPALSGKALMEIKEGEKDTTIALYEPAIAGPEAPSRGVLFLSGRWERFEGEAWQKLYEEAGLP